MILFLFVFIYILPIKILNVDIPFLTYLMSSHIFSSIFVLLCFLFVINGANLIDGFNGLLTINLIIINIILTYINITNQNLEFSILIISQIIILLTFLLFNFPNSKIFLGDSGAYTMGALTGLNTIITNNLNPKDVFIFLLYTFILSFFLKYFFHFLENSHKKNPLFIQMINIYICLVFIKYLKFSEKIKEII